MAGRADAVAAARRTTCRCAIYTRKSTEEGLDQEFNSLDAQREACEAYIRSQKHEGWILAKDRYDDGGYSGGRIDRPALTRLLEDVRSARVNTVVVYKVDRLTRSLHDFAKIVEVFDVQGVSFVSVTQQFNTTTSMGRLTLNMLLSFAQFEREVTGERIRDKIAASKKKGMWMGGFPPLGYDVRDRKLVVNKAEAEVLREIFSRYVELGSVPALVDSLNADCIRNKIRVNRHGEQRGGTRFTRGGLYKLLQNRILRGEIVHKGQVYDGEHAAIVDSELWNKVQAKLAENRVARDRGQNAREPGLLAGLVVDDAGVPMISTHACRKGRRYRYYVSRNLHAGSREKAPNGWRVPAKDLERLVSARLESFLGDEVEIYDAAESFGVDNRLRPQIVRQLGGLRQRRNRMSISEWTEVIRRAIERIEILPDRVRVVLAQAIFTADFKCVSHGRRCALRGRTDTNASLTATLEIPATLRRAGHEMRIVVAGKDPGARSGPDRSMHRLLGQAFRFRRLFMSRRGARISEIADELGICRTHFSRLFRVSCLSPEIVERILRDNHPLELNAKKLSRDTDLRISWSGQAALLIGGQD